MSTEEINKQNSEAMTEFAKKIAEAAKILACEECANVADMLATRNGFDEKTAKMIASEIRNLIPE